jgi:hypothetical protein
MILLLLLFFVKLSYYFFFLKIKKAIKAAPPKIKGIEIPLPVELPEVLLLNKLLEKLENYKNKIKLNCNITKISSEEIDKYISNASLDKLIPLMPKDINLDKNKDLLIVHIIPKNKGNVPLVIKDKGSFKLEIRQIDKPEDLKWIEPSTLKQISKINVLRNILTEKDDTYTLETNGDYEEIESIPLPHGIYWINSSLEYSDGVVNQSEIVKVPIK